jgi:isocitrate lyase
MGANKLWNKLNSQTCVAALGALTGNQAVQEVAAGLEAIYLSGWQVAADANLSGTMYPDQSLYPVNSVPEVVRRINNALLRSEQIDSVNGDNSKDWMAPIIADAEAGFGGNLSAFELMKAMIEAGAAAVHFEDQLSSAKKCGHLGGKVLVPTQEAVNKLIAARLAADVMGVPTIIIARTDAEAANLLTSDIDERDQSFLTGERTSEGFYAVKNGVEQCISRGLSYAPYADIIWMETSHPDLGVAKEFANAIHKVYPGKLLAYNCSPSFNWSKHLTEREMETFREELAALGYKFQFITLAGFHALNTSMFELSKAYRERGMAGFSQLQQREFALQEHGFKAVKHQSFVGTGYFDYVQNTVQQGQASTVAMKDSTEVAQFH